MTCSAKVGLGEFHDRLSARTVRRHAPARRDRARADPRSAAAADGRAVRRARCADARADAHRPRGAVDADAQDRAVHHALDRRGGAARRPRHRDVAAPRPHRAGLRHRARRARAGLRRAAIRCSSRRRRRSRICSCRRGFCGGMGTSDVQPSPEARAAHAASLEGRGTLSSSPSLREIAPLRAPLRTAPRLEAYAHPGVFIRQYCSE